MALDKTKAEADLAFLRTLVSADGDGADQRTFGAMYAVWGLAFAVPLLVQWFGMIGVLSLPPWYWAAAATAMSLLLIVLTIFVTLRGKPAVGVQARAWRAVFAGVGWANVAVLLGLVLVANNLKDGRILMIHAVIVFAFQGAAWYAVWALRKRAWTGLVAGGWFVFAAGLGATIPGPGFVLLAAVGLFLLMTVPGVVLIRTAPRAA